MSVSRWITGVAISLPLWAGAAATAQERPEDLLPLLAPLEAMNAERPAGPRRQAVQQELRAARRQLQRAGAGALSLPLALTGVLGNLGAATDLNGRDAGRAPALCGRFAAQAEEARHRAEAMLAAAGPPYPAYGLPPPPPSAPTVLLLRRSVLLATRDVVPPPAFQGLLQQMQQLAFGDEKIRLARDVAQGGARLSCREIAQLMGTTAFGDEQVEIAAALYPQARDPQGLPQLLAALPPADRQRLRQHLGR